MYARRTQVTRVLRPCSAMNTNYRATNSQTVMPYMRLAGNVVETNLSHSFSFRTNTPQDYWVCLLCAFRQLASRNVMPMYREVVYSLQSMVWASRISLDADVVNCHNV